MNKSAKQQNNADGNWQMESVSITEGGQANDRERGRAVGGQS